jgi:hypothetical protein
MKWALSNYNLIKKYGENLRKKTVKVYSIDRTLELHESINKLIVNS